MWVIMHMGEDAIYGPYETEKEVREAWAKLSPEEQCDAYMYPLQKPSRLEAKGAFWVVK